MSDRSRMTEARGLVQRLCTILRREDEQAGASTSGSTSAATGTGSAASSGEGGTSTSRLVATGVTSHISRRDEGPRAPSAIPSTSSPREIHQMLFGYQPSASAGVKKRTRSLSLFSRGRSASYAKKPKKLTPWSHCFVGLSDTDADTVPGDYSLLAANGLGKKKLQLFEQSSASDIHDAILEAFPKLSSAGGYELLRTAENSKRLTEIIPPPEGYSGTYLKNVLGQAKCFIRPIQNDIELIESPALEAGSQVSESVPRVKCEKCEEMIPMIQLRHHVESCSRAYKESDSSSGVEQGMANIVGDTPSNSGNASPRSTPSPISISDDDDDPVLKMVLEESLRESRCTSATITNLPRAIENIGDIIALLRHENGVNLETDDSVLHIDVRRDCLISDAIREGQKSKFDPRKVLKVCFVGEGGIDTGGPRREFFRLLVEEGSARYLLGTPGKMTFASNTIACQKSELKILGQYTAMSIVQGGPGFPVLHANVYNYIVTGKYIGVHTPDEDVANPTVVALLQELNDCYDDQSIKTVFANEDYQDILYTTGYCKPVAGIAIRDKAEIKQALKTHFMIKAVLAEINEFRDGLKVLNVLDQILKYPDIMRPCFVDEQEPLTAVTMKQMFRILYSPKLLPQSRKREEATFILFADFLDKCEAGEITVAVESLTGRGQASEPLLLSDILAFFTGADRIPPGGFSKNAPYDPKLKFLHDDDELLATASTCDLILRLPVKYHNDPEKFEEMMILSFKGYQGFGRV